MYYFLMSQLLIWIPIQRNNFRILKKQKTTIVNSPRPDSFKDVDCVVKIEIQDSGNKINLND